MGENTMSPTMKPEFLSLTLSVAKRFALPAICMVCGVFLSSCAVRPDLSEAEMTAARTFKAPPGKGMLYVYKEKEVRAMLAPRPIYINGQHLVSNTNGTFVSIPLKPGKYRVQAAANAPIDNLQYREAYPSINLTVRAGENYFIRQWVGGNIFTGSGQTSVMMLQTGGAPIPIAVGSSLPPFASEVVDEKTGRAACAELKHVGADPFEE